MNIILLLNALDKTVKYFNGTKYQSIVAGIIRCRQNSNLAEALVLAKSLPSEETLLKELIESLRGKSAYRTLKKIEENKITEGPQFLKGLFSLGTHVAIEIDKGHLEYRMLLPVIYEKLGAALYN